MAAMLLGNLGSSLLGPLGGWLGSMVGGMIDNALFGGNKDQEGPRLDDLNTVKADPGVPIPLVFGADRIPGIVIACTPLIETIHKEKVGGKGGPTLTTYTYHVSVQYMVSEGPILGIARIWAEGNLVRGTSYELETDTSENPEKIGGIPYPDYYLDHLYDPQLIPWTLNRSMFPLRDNGDTFIMSPNHLAMSKVTDAEAEDYLANSINVIYWQDSVTGYYIPIREDHAYGESKGTKKRPPQRITMAGSYRGAQSEVSGNDRALEKFYTFVDLGAFMSAEELRNIDESGGSISFDGNTGVWREEVFGGIDVSFRNYNVQFDFYRDGQQETVDGSETGSIISIEYVQFGVSRDARIAGSVSIPAETRFIQMSTTYAMFQPIFAAGTDWPGGNLFINFEKLFKEDEQDTRDWPDYWNLYDAINDFSGVAVLQFKGCDNLTVYHGTMDQQSDPNMREVLAVELEDKLEEGEVFEIPAYIGRAHIAFDTMQLADYGNRIPSFTFEVVQYDDVRIAMVLRDMMNRALVDEKYYDTSALPDIGQRSHVLGYSVGSKMTYRAAMETIMEAFRIDVAEVGNELIFRPKDRGFDWDIEWTDLAAQEAGSKVEDKIELYYRDLVEMPRSLTVRFKDVERNYNPNTAQYFRQQGISVQESVMELAAVMPPEIAKSYARDKMRDVWLERVGVKFKLPHKYVYVYPTDIVRINGFQYGYQDLVVKVTSVTRGQNGVLELEGVMHEQTVYVPQPGEVTRTRMDNSTWVNRPQPVITGPRFANVDLLDVAPLSYNERGMGVGYYCAISGGANFAGAGLYVSADLGETYTLVLTSYDNAVVGNTATTLDYHRAEFMDFTNSIEVILENTSDVLETITATQLYAGFNYFLLGKEIMQFMFAERVPSNRNRWKLSGLVRGRRNTDQDAILRGHVSGERFIMLEKGPVSYVKPERGDWTSNNYVKLVPMGGNLADSPPIEFYNSGNIMKPFAPVFVHRRMDEITGDLVVRFIRQDKYGWTWNEAGDTDLTENVWDHCVDIYDPTGTTIVRRILDPSTGGDPYGGNDNVDGQFTHEGYNYGYGVMGELLSGANSPKYTAAMQAADGYSPGDPIWVEVYKTGGVLSGHKTKVRI